jgi:hypothetical protein
MSFGITQEATDERYNEWLQKDFVWTNYSGEMSTVGLLLRFLDPLHFSGGYADILIDIFSILF